MSHLIWQMFQILHSWSYYPSTLSCSLCLRKNKYTFGSVGVFHQQSPCTWSLPCLYWTGTLQAKHGGVLQLPDSTKWRTRIYEHKHTEQDIANTILWNTGQRRTWVTPYQEVQTSRSTTNRMMHLKDEDGGKSCPEDLKHWILVGRGQHRRLKSPFLIKNDDPGVPSIECAINRTSFVLSRFREPPQ